MSTDRIENALLEGLREAHAIKEHGQTMLEGRAKRLTDYPALAEQLGAHARQTRIQKHRIEECIARLDSDTSTIKDIGSKLSAIGHSWGTQLAGEEAIQSIAASYAFEHFEIANYRALIVTAEAAGQPAIKQVCEELLGEEQAMADWLADHITETTRTYLQRTGSGG